MYSQDIEPVCRFCRHSRAAAGLLSHVECTLLGGYMPLSHTGCQKYEYDIFKRPVRRKKRRPDSLPSRFSKDDFSL